MVNQTTGGLYPTAPGDEPFLLVRIINDTQAELTACPWCTTTAPAEDVQHVTVFAGEQGSGILLDWPVTRVTVGSLDSPLIPSITATLRAGVDVVIPSLVNPAQAEADYNRGDTLVYRFTADTRNPAAITVSLSPDRWHHPDGAVHAGRYLPDCAADTGNRHAGPSGSDYHGQAHDPQPSKAK